MPAASRQLLCHPEFAAFSTSKKQVALITFRLALHKGLRMRSSTLESFIDLASDCLAYHPTCAKKIAAALSTVRLPDGVDEDALGTMPPREFAAEWLFDEGRREQIRLGDLLREFDAGPGSMLRRLVADSVAQLERELGQGAIRNSSYPSLDHLAALLELNDCEKAAILVGLLRSECRPFYDLLRSHDVSSRKEALRVLATVMGYDEQAFARDMGQKSRLYEYGIFNRESRISDLTDVFELGDEFVQILLAPCATLEEFVQAFLRKARNASLTPEDYPHMRDELEEVTRLLRGAIDSGARGIHVMLYGDPGSGKTEFARMLGARLDASLYEVDCQDQDGSSTTRGQRYTFLRIAQQFLSRSRNNLVLFDEAEDVFPADEGLDFFARLSGPRRRGRSDVSKAWLNRFLETSAVPVIWISNHIDQMDPANLRRFTYHLEFKAPPKPVREKIARRYLELLPVSQGFDARLADFDAIMPAQLEAASRFARLAAPSDSADAERLVLSQLKKSSKAIGEPLTRQRPSTATRYDPGLLNLDGEYAAEEIVDALARTGCANLCFYGPSGTGKTEFAAHIARQLGRELIVKSASNLLSMWVGGTEKNIRAMFEQAEDAGRPSVLLLDEADTLLRDRTGAQHSWEASQVNEFLHRMEMFNGIFVCTTNLFDDIDRALLRRFAFKVQFRPLNAEQRWAMFLQEFGAPVQGVQDAARERILAMDGLVPGDFATVRKRMAMLGKAFPVERIVSMLEAEKNLRTCAVQKRGIGFLQALGD
ncbi:MAG TPA: AAA family ATPase [Noviherbaspirillum sp.]|nr:AAA family ATPase [Noviherbaspirillum sp.]